MLRALRAQSGTFALQDQLYLPHAALDLSNRLSIRSIQLANSAAQDTVAEVGRAIDLRVVWATTLLQVAETVQFALLVTIVIARPRQKLLCKAILARQVCTVHKEYQCRRQAPYMLVQLDITVLKPHLHQPPVYRCVFNAVY